MSFLQKTMEYDTLHPPIGATSIKPRIFLLFLHDVPEHAGVVTDLLHPHPQPFSQRILRWEKGVF